MNYTPISITSSFAKLFEKIIAVAKLMPTIKELCVISANMIPRLADPQSLISSYLIITSHVRLMVLGRRESVFALQAVSFTAMHLYTN